ncbi:epidermal differentiation-specific protein-like [Microcaecilia unicolor]|uniref:Epidermal differentiation-specific protein-like n=1 Tax=Microcaecilia unicolor TaxID=1415580 RepID=A0A6P7WME3_9AMPH|nr:epidermal differentiation-specific protein-like [Microcaecilia unicolor]
MSVTPTKVNKIVVYEFPDFKGLKREFISDVKDLREISFNDCICSLIVIGQPWIAYEHIQFGGWLREYEEGEYSNIEIHDTISSLQLITDDLRNPKITIYEHPNYKGKNQTFTEETNLCYGNFNTMASSHIVEKGAWILYENANRRGQRILARAGERFADYGKIGFNDKVSYLRPLKAGCAIVKSNVLWDKMKKENEICFMVDEFIGVNRSDFEQEFSSRSKEYESSVTYDFKFSNTTTIEAGVEFKLMLIPSVSIKISNSISIEKGKSETVTQRDRFQLTLPAKIPPHTKITITVMKKAVTVIIPVELTVEQNQKITIEYGELRCQMGSTIYAEYDSEKI